MNLQVRATPRMVFGLGTDSPGRMPSFFMRTGKGFMEMAPEGSGAGLRRKLRAEKKGWVSQKETAERIEN